MDWRKPKRVEKGAVRIPDRWLFLHYYEAFNILFRVENALRVFVYVVLKNKYFDKWSSIAITSEDGDGTIASIAAKRRAQAGTFGYLGYPVSSPLLYLNTGELTRLITADSYWPLFKPYFVAAKNIVTTKFDEINSVRNALAHFRPIREDDLDTVKQSSKHILSKVEQTLSDLILCSDTVPTNTAVTWYTGLSGLAASHCQMRFRQSADEAWYRIDVLFVPPLLSSNRYNERYVIASALALNTPAVLSLHPKLCSLVTYLTESVGYAQATLRAAPPIPITLSFGFSRDALTSNADTVRAELESLLQELSAETTLIQQDNLARGKLLRPVQTNASIPADAQVASYAREAFQSPFRPDDPAEWWGQISLFAEDFISATHVYPWMSTDVAKLSLFDDE